MVVLASAYRLGGELLDLLPVAVYTCDASGVIERYNKRAAELWGHAPVLGDTDLRFCGSFRLYHVDGRPLPHAETPMAEVLRTGVTVRDQELVIERPDGSRVTALVNIAPITNDLGQVVGAINCFADVTERKRAEALLAERERELADFFENGAISLHWVAADGTILRANRAELALLGYHADEYIGRNIVEFHVHRYVIDDILARLSAGEVLHDYPAQLRCKDGSIRHVLIDSSVLWDNGEFRHTRCFTRDVTMQRQAEQRIKVALEAAEQARAEAERASRAKSDFLAVMSHELRTPLNAIAGYTELLELGVHGPLTDAQREALSRIQRSQQHLAGLINGVLNYAHIESGTVRYEVSDVPMDQVLSATGALILPQANAKGIAYTYARCDRGLAARADAEKLQQIVLNLLSNAVKFTPAGGQITMECEAAGSSVVLRVKDTGRGIPSDRLESIFEPFVQIDSGLTRAQEGVGLGLAISRDLARGMGGDLVADSVVGRGSTFTLTLQRT